MRIGKTGRTVEGALLAGALILLLPAMAFAQSQNPDITPPQAPQPGQSHIPPNTRVIQGTVRDQEGAPVPGAVVLLKDSKTLQIRSYITQADGVYHFYGLSTDVGYQVRAEHGDRTSPYKLVSVFDSHKIIKVDLKLKKQKKPYPS